MEDDLEIKVNRELVSKDSTGDLENIKSIEFATEEEIKGSDYQFTTDIDKGDIFIDTLEAPISVIREMLDEAEKAGANYVSIEYHCDHMEYDIYGLKIERASAEVVDEQRENEMILEEAKKMAKISELEKELKELKSK